MKKVLVVSGISLILALGLGLVFGLHSGGARPSSAVLVERFKRAEEAENQAFARLVFSEPQVFAKSLSLKFTVKDQLGGSWLFKASERGQSDGAVAVYRIYNLLGLNTPEIHYVTLPINGEQVPGTLQRLVPNLGNLSDDVFWKLSPSEAEYFAKNHALAWLIANNYVHPGQWIAATSDGKTRDEFLRVDNSIEWQVMGLDSLDMHYGTPMLWHAGKRGFALFWRTYLQKGFELNVSEILAWADLAAGVPDEFYLAFFERGIQNDLGQMSNNGVNSQERLWWYDPFIAANADRAGFPRRLLDRKKSFGRDLREFYRGIVRARGNESLPSSGDREEVQKNLLGRLDLRAGASRLMLAELEKVPRVEQAQLELAVSPRAYSVLRDLVEMQKLSIQVQDQLMEKAATGLAQLRAEISGKRGSEKQARGLGFAIENFALIREIVGKSRSGGKISPQEVKDILLNMGAIFEAETKSRLQATLAKLAAA